MHYLFASVRFSSFKFGGIIFWLFLRLTVTKLGRVCYAALKVLEKLYAGNNGYFKQKKSLKLVSSRATDNFLPPSDLQLLMSLYIYAIKFSWQILFSFVFTRHKKAEVWFISIYSFYVLLRFLF